MERLALDDSQYLVRALLNLNGSINGTTRKDDEELWVELADNKRLRLTSYRLGIRARVASSSEEVSLVQNNCRREKDGAERPVTMAVAPGGQLSDIMAHSEMSMASSTMTLNSMTSHSTTSYSMATQSSTQNGLPKVVSFSRLQFKASTGNSNRKSRQFFVMDLALYGFVEGTTTDPVCLAVASSVPVAVRGRSPSYYERPNEASDAANKHFPASPLSPSVYVGFDGINLATSPLLSPSRVPSPLDEANRFADAITQLPAFAAYLQAMSPSPNAVDNVLMTSPQHPAMATFPVSPQHSPLVPLPVSPRVTSQFLAPSPMNVQRRRDSWSTPNVQGLLHPHPHAVALGGPARRNSTGLPQDFLSPMTLSLAMGEQQGIAAAEKPLVQEAKGQAMATPYSPDGITDETLDLYLSSFMVDQ